MNKPKPPNYKAITDAPNLRGDNQQSCGNCNFFKWLPSPDAQTESGETVFQQPRGMCAQHAFETQANYVCDDWQVWQPQDARTETETSVNAETDAQKNLGNALKTVAKTDDELRVGNYIVLFGGRDLSALETVGNKSPRRKNKDGSHGEFFTAQTQYDSPHTAIGTFPVGWEHGFEEIGADVALGYVDWNTKSVDSKGVFVERVLNRRNQYVKWIEELLDAGLIGSSSEADPRLIRVKNTGEITQWGLMGDTLSVQPAEPRNLSENQMQAYKALTTHTPQAEPKATVATGAAQATVTAASNAKTVIATSQGVTIQGVTQEEKKEMDKELQDALAANTEAMKNIGARVETLEATLKAEKPANNGGTNIQVESDEKRPYKAFKKNARGEIVDATGYGEFLQDVMAAQTGTKSVAPRLANLIDMNAKAHKAYKAATGLGINVPSEGGYFAQSDHSAELVQMTFATGKILSRVRPIPIGAGADSITLNGVDESSRASTLWGGIVAYWVSEAEAPTGTKPKFRQIRLEPHGLSALYYATDKLLRVAPALGSLVAQGFREAMTFKVEDAIVNGTGTGKPLGILSAVMTTSGKSTISITKEANQAAATIVTTNLSKMWARLFPQAKEGAVWLINTDTNPQLDELAIPVGTGGIEPRFVNYGPDGLLRIKGREVIEVEYCPTLGTLGDITLWNPSTYLFADLGVVEEASSIHVNFTAAETAFRFLYYCDGQPMIENALTPFKGTNTLGTATAIATRA